MFVETTPISHVPTGDIATIHSHNAMLVYGSSTPKPVLSGDQLLDLAVQVLSFDHVTAAAWLARASEVLLKHRRESPAKSTSCGMAPWQVNRVIAFVDDRLAATIRANDCAKTVRLSTSHFSRVFKVSFKQTFGQYLIQRRVERAQELMLVTSEPLCQIALNCGFADQSHLSRSFRNVTNVSPAAWRRRHQTKAGYTVEAP